MVNFWLKWLLFSRSSSHRAKIWYYKDYNEQSGWYWNSQQNSSFTVCLPFWLDCTLQKFIPFHHVILSTSEQIVLVHEQGGDNHFTALMTQILLPPTYVLMCLVSGKLALNCRTTHNIRRSTNSSVPEILLNYTGSSVAFMESSIRWNFWSDASI